MVILCHNSEIGDDFLGKKFMKNLRNRKVAFVFATERFHNCGKRMYRWQISFDPLYAG